MTSEAVRFSDREDAGRRLVRELTRFVEYEPIVLGLPRGGIPVAAPIASALHAPLDVLIVRKVGAPSQPELGVGAVAEGDVQVIDTVLCRHLGIPDDVIPGLVCAAAEDVDAHISMLRHDHPRLDVAGRVVIVVDDGLATGSTAHAAIRSARRAGAQRVILAAPVGSIGAVRRMRSVADEVVCLSTPRDFASVGHYYDDFGPVDDIEVLTLLGDGTRAEVHIDTEGHRLPASLVVPPLASMLVVFAHGSGSSRLSSRNRDVARVLNEAGIATLLMDLLTEDEASDRHNVFDVERLANRLEAAVAWSRTDPRTQHLGVGLFGASTGAAAAIAVAARCPELVSSVVSRGGRPDLARPWLPLVQAPTLLIVGGDDVDVLRLNREARTRMVCPSALEIVPGAGHLFEEPGALSRVATLARGWFARALTSRAA